ncbi:MAG TPA: tol-pal system protein YbgF [Candidatus Methylomirabilis sp.]|nr:tol-pal system protein YbgF [Candidatus Methylomirabilis sp.]
MMMVRYLVWLLLVGAALLGNACMAKTEDVQALQQEVRTLRGEVNAMAKRDGGSRPTDLVARVEELAVETRMVQGQLEEANYRLSQLGKRLDATEVKVARLSGEAVKPGGTGQLPAPLPGAAPEGGATQPGSSPGQPLPPRSGSAALPQAPGATAPERPVMQGSLPSPEEVYTKALNDYHKGNYDLAINGFKSYLTFYPKTSLVPNAQYWLGESYYGQRKYREAIREFDKLIKEYPDSAKVPGAMLKQGYAYLELNEKAQGKRVLQELKNKYPNSGDARRAQDTLQGLQ